MMKVLVFETRVYIQTVISGNDFVAKEKEVIDLKMI